MDKEQTHLPTVMFTLVTTSTASHMAKENTYGPPAKFILVTFTKVKNMVVENGVVPGMFNHATLTKESTRTTENMEKESLPGQVATFTKEILSMMRGKVMVKCFGQKVACTKVNGLVVFSMDSVV